MVQIQLMYPSSQPEKQITFLQIFLIEHCTVTYMKVLHGTFLSVCYLESDLRNLENIWSLLQRRSQDVSQQLL